MRIGWWRTASLKRTTAVSLTMSIFAAYHSTVQLTSQLQEENHEEILQEQILFLAEHLM